MIETQPVRTSKADWVFLLEKGEVVISPMISKMTNIFILGVLSVVLTFSSASESSHRKDVTLSALSIQAIESSWQVKAMNEKVVTGSLSSRKDLYRDYRIGQEDLIGISVFEEEKWSDLGSP